MAQGEDGFSDREVARVVLQLDEAVALKRRAAIARLAAHQDAVPILPVRPSRIELAVLTALAQTYGPALLEQPSFAPVLDCIAECGAVVLVQRVLFGEAWGERSEDVRLAARLLAARVPFEILCGTWPEVFLAQAHAELRGFMPRSPGSPDSPEPSDGKAGGDD
ncbi:hypothetical protein [Caballeronia humi]|uniref:Uncharacterized protein n=1 Tax=Caballeronia humi TaxID=326474 RepID=A0A158J208_9BURK|nr:hypothetical protein [Caballeronia humi]SAL62409.1 hypothetical protein AWB65_05731 [Caballeronia humi]